MLTQNLAPDIAAYLEQQGIGTRAVDIFVASMPDSPANALVIAEDQGTAADIDLPVEYPRFQILVRADHYQNGRARIQAVRNAIHGTIMTRIGTTDVMNLFADSSAGYIGKDEAGRSLFSVNFRGKIR